MIRFVIFVWESENLDVLFVCYHYSLLFELVLLPEAFHASLAEAYKSMTQLSMNLKERTYWASHDNLDFNRRVWFNLANRHGWRSVFRRHVSCKILLLMYNGCLRLEEGRFLGIIFSQFLLQDALLLSDFLQSFIPFLWLHIGGLEMRLKLARFELLRWSLLLEQLTVISKLVIFIIFYHSLILMHLRLSSMLKVWLSQVDILREINWNGVIMHI